VSDVFGNTLTPSLGGEGTELNVLDPNPLPQGQIRLERIWSNEVCPEGVGQDSPTTKGRVRVIKPC